ncbi:hypothetical protein [Actinomadura oligospora]|uniref:hypothetical protein n=1 Tax=Actinomadura oligospora TaxID=111804 RepID=UPI0004AE942A|nr:hypothetical protein [Actinomadura oligospora]
MADAWLPAAVRLPARLDGGALRGGAPRAVWLTSGSDPRAVSARSLAADLAKIGRPAHLVWNPLSGELVQQIPILRASLALAEDGPEAGSGPGHEGRICAQIMVVGEAREPFTGGALTGLDPILRWLDGWGVARRWPAGPPLPTPQSYESRRERRAWARGGHFGASQVPDVVRPDPGGIDVRRVTGPDTTLPALPRPRPVAGDDGPLGNGSRKTLLTRAAPPPPPPPAPTAPPQTPRPVPVNAR